MPYLALHVHVDVMQCAHEHACRKLSVHVMHVHVLVHVCTTMCMCKYHVGRRGSEEGGMKVVRGGRKSKMLSVAFFRSLSENTRLADIVDAVAVLEKAIVADTGITSEACTCIYTCTCTYIYIHIYMYKCTCYADETYMYSRLWI